MGVKLRGLFRHEAADNAAPAPAMLNRLADSLDDPWVAFAPTASAETGALGPVGGTGVVVGSCRYKRMGGFCIATYSVTLGATGAGSGAGALILGLPFPAVGTDYGTGREPLTTGVELVCWTNGSTLRAVRFDNATMIGNNRRAQLTISYEPTP